MSDKKRHTVTTIETHEFWIVRRPAPASGFLCIECPDRAGMLTPQEAAQQAGVSQRTVYRWVEDGRVHFAESPEGDLLVCLAPLVANPG